MEKEKQERKALEFAKEHVSEDIVDMEKVAIVEGKVFFRPKWSKAVIESLVITTGPPCFYVLDNGRYRRSSEDEFDNVTSLLQKQLHNPR